MENSNRSPHQEILIALGFEGLGTASIKSLPRSKSQAAFVRSQAEVQSDHLGVVDEPYSITTPEQLKTSDIHLFMVVDELESWMLSASLRSEHEPNPRVLVEWTGEESSPLYCLPLGLDGRLPPQRMLNDDRDLLTLLDVDQGAIILKPNGSGLFIYYTSDHELLSQALTPPQMSSITPLKVQAVNRLPEWVLTQLKDQNEVLQRTQQLGAIARYLSPHKDEKEAAYDSIDIELFRLIEELEGWELLAERSALAQVTTLKSLLKELADTPSQAVLNELILLREQLSLTDTIEQIVGFSGPLHEALSSFDQEAIQTLERDVIFKSLKAPDHKVLTQARGLGYVDWWLKAPDVTDSLK